MNVEYKLEQKRMKHLTKEFQVFNSGKKGFKLSNQYIAQVKFECGLGKRENYSNLK